MDIWNISTNQICSMFERNPDFSITSSIVSKLGVLCLNIIFNRDSTKAKNYFLYFNFNKVQKLNQIEGVKLETINNQSALVNQDPMVNLYGSDLLLQYIHYSKYITTQKLILSLLIHYRTEDNLIKFDRFPVKSINAEDSSIYSKHIKSQTLVHLTGENDYLIFKVGDQWISYQL